MNQEKDDKKTSLNINATLIVAIATAYIYLCSYIFEVAQCSIYNIPIMFISPSLSTILVLSLFTAICLYFTFGIFNVYVIFFDSLLKIPFENLYRLAVIGIFFLVTGLIIHLRFAPNVNMVLWLFLTALAAAIIMFFKITISKYIVKVIRARENGKQQESKDLILDKIASHKNSGILVPLVMTSIIYILSIFIYGSYYAASKDVFSVLSGHPNVILLKKYDDILFCRPFDFKTKNVKDSLIVIKITDKSNLVFHSENLGILHYPEVN